MKALDRLYMLRDELLALHKGRTADGKPTHIPPPKSAAGQAKARADGYTPTPSGKTWAHSSVRRRGEGGGSSRDRGGRSLASRVREMHDHPDTHPEAKKVLAKLLGEHEARGEARGEERPRGRGAGGRSREPRAAAPQEAVDKALAVYEAVRDNVRRVEFSEIEDKLQPLRHMDRGVLFEALQQIGGRPKKSDTTEAHVAGFVKVLRRLKAQADEIDRI